MVIIEYRADMRIADKFKLVKKIGSGAFGEIYKGKLRFNHRRLNMDRSSLNGKFASSLINNQI